MRRSTTFGRLSAVCLAGATAFGFALVAGQGVASALPPYAHSYVVNTNTDPTPVANACTPTSTTTVCSFSEALIAYGNDTSGPDLITFAPSTSGHTFFVTTSLVADNTNGVALTISGNGGQNTVLDGSSDAEVLTFESTGPTTMTGVVVQHGSSTNGGGIGITGTGVVTLSNDAINDNTAADNGGGISVGSGDTLNLSNSSLSTNSATSGGAIYNDGTLNLTSTRFSSNNASEGGAIYNDTDGSATVNSSVIGGASSAANDAIDGGGIYNLGTITLTATNVSYNNYNPRGLPAEGGGVSNYGTLTVNGGTINQNAALDGGGIYNDGSLVNLGASAQVESNEALFGGGIDNDEDGALQLSQGATVARNAAFELGGGILNCGSTQVTAASVDSNQSLGDGGGIYNSGTEVCEGDDAPTASTQEAGSPSLNTVSADVESTNPCGEMAETVTPSITVFVNGSLTMTQGDLSRNFACEGGGGLFSDEATSTISGSTINNNSVNQGSDGGGVYSEDDTTFSLAGDTLSGDSAPDGDGGGANIESDGVLISGGSFSHDSAEYGGAIENFLGDLTVDGTPTPVTFVDNSASYDGGAIDNFLATTTVQGSFNFAGNAAYYGGAISNDEDSDMIVNGSSPTLSTIYRNSATYEGGGIYNSGDLTLNETGVTYNTAGSNGGGVYSTSPFSGTGNVITNNTPNNVVS